MLTAKILRRSTAILIAIIGLCACSPDPSAPGTENAPAKTAPADLVLTNAKIYTVDAQRSWASMLAITGGKIVRVGDEADAFIGENTRVVDLGGKMVLPGFQDAHSHLAPGGVAYTACPLFESPGLEAMLEGVRKCVEAKPDAEIIRGEGWNMELFPDGIPPGKELLDAIDDSRPLVFGDSDGHALWLNSAALETYGITRDTEDPPGGKIARLPGSREPSGTLHEESAMDLAMNHWPPYTDAEIEAGLRWAQDYFLSLGITATQDAFVKPDGGSHYRALPAYLSVQAAGDLKLRVSIALGWQSGGGDAWLEEIKALRQAHDGQRLRVNMVKFWADGVVETRTAFMLEPYSDQPDTHGLMMIPRDELMEFVPKVDAAGLQVHIHAIGDATVRYALDAIEEAWRQNGRRDARHHINHVQFVHPDDIPRFKELDVGASFEPYWAYEDDYITYLTRPRVGEERIKQTYPIGSILRTGARVAFSSDWSVTSADPLLGMETAISRVDPHSNEGEVFLPDERISLEQAIAAYTITAAELSRLDETTGSIEPGKYADLVVLDHNLFDIPVAEISDAHVIATLIDGEVVYGTLQ